MNIKALMAEYQHEIDDIRWYLASVMVESFFTFKDNKRDLIQKIWSGKLESELYNMEERFLVDLQNQADRGLMDEASLRELFSEIEKVKQARLW
ncbi:MAG: hypothetical protein AB1798_03050 [Spirochaetota bacterium]